MERGAGEHGYSKWGVLRAQRKGASRIGRATARMARRASLAFVVATACALGLTAAPAFAGPSHVFSTTFGAADSTPANPYPLSNPADTAVDNSSGSSAHDVYVTDPANHRVEKFDSSGNFILMFGKGVDQTTGGDVCTATSGDTCQAGASDSSPGAFTTPTFVAVDGSSGPSAGDVYVGDNGNALISKFDSSGNLIASWGSSGQLNGFGGALAGVAVDSLGNLFAFNFGANFFKFGQDGSPISSFYTGYGVSGAGITVDPSGNLYQVRGIPVVEKFTPAGQDLGQLTDGGNAKGLEADPRSGDLYENEGGTVINHYDSSCNPSSGPCSPVDTFGSGNLTGAQGLAIDGVSNNVYVANTGAGNVAVFDGANPLLTTGSASNLTVNSATVSGHVDPFGRGDVTDCHFDYGPTTAYGSSALCSSPTPYSSPTDVSADLSGLTAGTTYHYRLIGTNGNGTYFGSDESFKTVAAVQGVSTDPATNITAVDATLNGSLDPAGLATQCYFDYGSDTNYGQTTSTPPGDDDAGSLNFAKDVSGLQPNSVYHFRIVCTNVFGTTVGSDQSFTTAIEVAGIVTLPTGPIATTTASVGGRIQPNNSATTYYIEYGTDTNYGQSQPSTQDAPVGADLGSYFVSQQLTGLQPNTTYHYRIVADNPAGPNQGADHTFTTLASSVSGTCPNDLARQQTGAAALLDCRAYELVSAANAGGYDVESSVIAGQTPFGAYPQANNPPRVLYAVHSGGIPGTGNPTNRGPDPYVATRDPKAGWSTEYVGIPANGTPSAAPFASTLAEANGTLDTFAFAGPDICAPCFASGIATGIPIHTPNGSLIQGMAGSIDPGPSAAPDGYIAKHFSADGSHFLFGSTSRFEPDGNNNGDVSIYDRDLNTGVTNVVSKTPGGANLPCLQGAGQCSSPGDGNGIAELDVSADGSRIIVAQKVSTGGAGNVYFHPYINIGDSTHTVDLAPGTTQGVLFGGMTQDGSKVFFTTADQLLPADTDSSADIYEADVDSGGNLTLHLVSTGSGGPSNTDSCDPVSNSNGSHWNTVGGAENCDAVAIAGGGGVAIGDGTVYFLSPEKLTPPCACLLGDPTPDQPNLYLARPGFAPHFIATLDPNDPAVLDAVGAAGTLRYGDFQVAPSGDAAAFLSTAPLVGYDNAGHPEVYRYDAPSDDLVCASCSPITPQATSDAALAPNGLSVTDDGRVFFTTPEPLVAADLNEKRDVYEFSHGVVQLLSTGTSPFDSGMLGVSADGTDAYFFTTDTLVSQDHNGQAMKIYDARSNGGFFVVPPRASCAASDECHGPGTQAPSPPSIHTAGTTPGNLTPEPKQCHHGRVLRHGKCVKKHHGKSNKGRRANHSRGGVK
jgi:hypothetical protein